MNLTFYRSFSFFFGRTKGNLFWPKYKQLLVVIPMNYVILMSFSKDPMKMLSRILCQAVKIMPIMKAAPEGLMIWNSTQVKAKKMLPLMEMILKVKIL